MISFNEVNRARTALKMKLSQFAWYQSSHIINLNNDFVIVITVNKLDNKIRKFIPAVWQNIKTKIETNKSY